LFTHPYLTLISKLMQKDEELQVTDINLVILEIPRT